jgi:hypothetical protein
MRRIEIPFFKWAIFESSRSWHLGGSLLRRGPVAARLDEAVTVRHRAEPSKLDLPTYDPNNKQALGTLAPRTSPRGARREHANSSSACLNCKRPCSTDFRRRLRVFEARLVVPKPRR